MRKSMLSMILVAVATIGLYSQESPVLMTIADEDISLHEFERIYRKNNNDASLNKQTPEEYLELFINFKLKVMEAESLGMDTTTKFINELEGYREQLAKPYLIDEETREILIMEAYERAQTDVNASHILIKTPANPTPEDTLAAYEKILEIRNRIFKGEDFESVARATSEDGSAGRNGGNLGYFTVFSMIYSFESMAYTTPVGKISMPFRSSYGYHILKVNDLRPARGQIKVAHVFVRTPAEMNEGQKEEAYAKAQMIYDSISMGRDFAYMASNYSEDPSSAKNGGEIPWFGTGRMIPEFENASHALENKGDYTKPFKSFYGWHIVKLIDRKEIGTYEELLPDLQEKANRGDRMQFQTELYVERLKADNGFTEYREGIEKVYAATDSSLLMGAWKGGNLENDPTPLIKTGKRNVSIGEFVSYIMEKQKRGKSRHIQSYVDELYTTFIRESVIDYEDSVLADKYPEFRYIYEEYHDGILLFDIMDQKVWSKAVSDTLGLTAFHNSHKGDYMWEQRSDALVISCGEDANVAGIRKAYKKIIKGRLDEAALNLAYCASDTVPCVTVENLIVVAGKNSLVDDMNGQTGMGPVVAGDGSNSFVILKEVISPEPKKLNEARGQITSDYQNYLEKQWIAELKTKYSVEVDSSLLSGIKN
ncbi:MAG: peptidylprolyl isomerase [Bacteroidetes bacterium]|nr:peptidylprolyl isomerase [Bacteroidota bacterium]